jgi:hypothetical protein
VEDAHHERRIKLNEKEQLMNRSKRSLFFALLISISLTTAAFCDGESRAALLADSSLSLLAPFDGSANATKPVEAKPVKIEGVEFSEGLIGGCLSLQQPIPSSINFSAKSAVRLNEGTIMFWFRPNWSGADTNGKYTLLWLHMKNSSSTYLAIHRSFTPSDPRQLTINLSWVNVIQTTTRTHFVEKEWIHVAITWDVNSNSFTAYFNGKAISTVPWKDVTADPDYNPEVLTLGLFNRGEDGDNPINACYDDLMVFHRSLNSTEIGDYVEETKPSSK